MQYLSRRLPALIVLGLASLHAHAQTQTDTLSAAATSVAAVAPAVMRSVAPASSLPPIDERWAASFAAFDEADRLNAPKPGGVLFVGSSSIRLWDGLETQFGGVLKRGFGGSQLSDCARHVARLVLPYRPSVVVVYAGDNDLAAGRDPADVLQSYRQLVEQVHAALPETRIAYVSIKPSPSRQAQWAAVRESNELIRRYTEAQRKAGLPLGFIDVHTAMLDAAARPRTELFGDDGLHLNKAGYALWTTLIQTYLQR